MTTVGLLVCLFAADPAEDKAPFQEWLKFYGAAAAKYQIDVQNGAGQFEPIQLQPMPILQYTNPERGYQQHGAFYVWTLKGRPQCIGSIWSTVPADDPQHRWVAHELHSLSSGPLRSQHEPRDGRRGPVPQWETQQPGITWITADDVPAPAGTPSLRLVQMRRLAEQFTVRITNPTQGTEGDLRLLPKPLYRYPAETEGAVDGGLFAFVMGTDPEVLLLVEATPSDQGAASRWRFGLARFTHIQAVAQRNGELVWQCDNAEPYVGHNPYFLYWRLHPAGLTTP